MSSEMGEDIVNHMFKSVEMEIGGELQARWEPTADGSVKQTYPPSNKEEDTVKEVQNKLQGLTLDIEPMTLVTAEQVQWIDEAIKNTSSEDAGLTVNMKILAECRKRYYEHPMGGQEFSTLIHVYIDSCMGTGDFSLCSDSKEETVKQFWDWMAKPKNESNSMTNIDWLALVFGLK